MWGIDDATRKPIGTAVDLRAKKHGAEEFENWLAHLLEPRIAFEFAEITLEGHRLFCLRVSAATGQPVRFSGTEYIRIGSLKKKLKEHPGKEAELWRVLDRRPFEAGSAAENLSGDDVIDALDYPALFQLFKAKLPEGRSGILGRLETERLIKPTGVDRFLITNLGALLFARSLARFDTVARKAVRLIRYRGNNRVETEREHAVPTGYASGFESLIDSVNQLAPENEHLGGALRSEVRMYPKVALRELIANAMIHQDLTLSGTGPMVEIFDDRMEISSPGLPLISTLRFIDHAPRSRNEMMADLMRRLHICEERGSSHAPLTVWLTTGTGTEILIALSMSNVATALGSEGEFRAEAGLPIGAVSARVVGNLAAAQKLLRRAFQLARTLPHEILHAFEKATAGLPRSTEIERLVIQRVGQDLFRSRLVEYWQGRCAVTGLGVVELLRASHIKPWAACATDAERLDVFNGLLLAPQLDAAFDRGFVTFADDGGLLVSPSLGADARCVLRLDEPLRAQRLVVSHASYLGWHRANVFRA